MRKPLFLLENLVLIDESHYNVLSLFFPIFTKVNEPVHSQGLWDTRVLNHKALLTNDLLGTNKSAIFSPSAIWENSEIPKSLLPHFAMEPFLFKWSLKLELWSSVVFYSLPNKGWSLTTELRVDSLWLFTLTPHIYQHQIHIYCSLDCYILSLGNFFHE